MRGRNQRKLTNVILTNKKSNVAANLLLFSQRAERAAKVRNHIKKTVAEPNLLLGQEEAVKSHAGKPETASVGLLVERIGVRASDGS